MKKVINKKVYNTDTATQIGVWENGHYTSDFAYACERLYVTRKGAYFIHGEGGAYSSYRAACGNSFGYGEEIKVLTESEALAWASEKLGGDIVDEHFSGLLEEA